MEAGRQQTWVRRARARWDEAQVPEAEAPRATKRTALHASGAPRAHNEQGSLLSLTLLHAHSQGAWDTRCSRFSAGL